MADTSAAPAARHDSVYNNGRLSGGIVQQGTGHAARDLYSGPVTIIRDRQPKSAPSSTVPFRRDNDFVHRGSLDDIGQICAQPAGCAALVGLGGVGKSQLAIEYTHQVRDELPATWVFWVHAGTQARFEQGYRRIAEATKMDGWDDAKADVLRLVRSWLCDESNGRWLMVVDNADDEAVFFQDMSRNGSELLSDFLPQSPNGSILVTSRSRDVAYKLTGAHSSIVEVKPMDRDAALALLQKNLGPTANGDEALELVYALDAMPLALTQAAAFIKQRAPRMSVARYVGEIRGNDRDRARLLEKDVGDSRRDGRSSNSIIATWQISFEYIRKRAPNAARLLSLMSLFDRQGIPESLLHDRYVGHEDRGADFDDDIDVLSSFSLVEISVDGSEFEMHRLVQFSTKKWLELNNKLEEWKITYVMLMNENYPVGEHENWSVCQKLFPHAEVVLNGQPEDIEARKAWASLLFKAAWYASDMGQYSKAYEMDSSALQAREVVLGSEHADTLSSLNNLGLVLNRQGRYNEAEEMHKQALEAKRRVLGADHPSTLTSMANLALTYWNQGWWKDAEELEVQVMETRKIKLKVDHPDTLASIANLASMYRNQGRWKDAEKLEVQVIETSKTKLGADHPLTLTSMANLASTYRNQGRWKDAEELFVQVIETRKTKLGADHPDMLTSVANLASTYRNQGRWKDAEELEVQVIETSKTKLGADHPSTLTSIANLASTYRNQGRLKDAEELEVQVMETSKTKLGADHPDTLTSMANLACTFKDQGDKDKAISLLQDCCRLREEVLGPRHPHTVLSQRALATWRLEAIEITEYPLGRAEAGLGRAPSYTAIASITCLLLTLYLCVT